MSSNLLKPQLGLKKLVIKIHRIFRRMKADDNRKVTLWRHSWGRGSAAVLKQKVDFMHRVADKDGIKETCLRKKRVMCEESLG